MASQGARGFESHPLRFSCVIRLRGVVVYIIFAASLILGAIGTAVSDTAVGRIVFNLISSTITAPVAAPVAAVIYFRLLATKGEAAPA